MLARSHRILLAAWVTRGAAITAAFPVLFYGLLAGMSPATQRAVIMVLVFLVGLLFEREQDHMNTLAIAALIILIISPASLFEVSFQLSFVAVFAIMYMLKYLPLAQTLRHGPHKRLKRLGLFLLVSAAAIMGTLPITLYYFNQTSLIGLFANCLMVPLVGLLVVPLGLLSVLLSAVTSVGGLYTMKGAIHVMGWGLDVTRFLSTCPFAAVKTVTPTLLEIGLYYCLAWALLNTSKSRLAKVGLVACVMIAFADMAYWVNQRCGRNEVRITYIDVGQGNAALLELPRGLCILVDGGGFYDNSFDVGAKIVAPFLWQKKIATVETLVLSHPHPDHLNGFLFVAQNFNVREVWMNQDEASGNTYREFLKIASEKGITVLGPRELETPRTMSGVRFQVLYPPTDFLDRKRNDRWRTTNNNSLVLKATFKEISFLFPGDIGDQAERELTALSGNALKSDVLLVPHHGSKTSSTHSFLACVDPAIAVVSAGQKNIFHLPHDTVVQKYQALGCRVFCISSQGAITVTTDGIRLRAKPLSSASMPLGFSLPHAA